MCSPPPSTFRGTATPPWTATSTCLYSGRSRAHEPVEWFPSRRPLRRGFRHDRAHRRPGAGAARFAGHAVARNPHRCAVAPRLSRPGGYRCARDGASRRVSPPGKPACGRSKPAPTPLLMPTDPDAAIKAVVAAVESGRLTRQRIRESVVNISPPRRRSG